jgi:hypothetical protein
MEEVYADAGLEFSRSDYELVWEGREHLVKKTITDKRGHKRTVWVNPEKGKPKAKTVSAKAQAPASQTPTPSAPPVSTPAPAGSAMDAGVLKDHISDTFQDLLRDKYSHTYRVPIHELRDEIRKKLGDDAASNTIFNQTMIDMSKSGEFRLVEIDDRSTVPPETLSKSISASSGLLYYVKKQPNKFGAITDGPDVGYVRRVKKAQSPNTSNNTVVGKAPSPAHEAAASDLHKLSPEQLADVHALIKKHLGSGDKSAPAKAKPAAKPAAKVDEKKVGDAVEKLKTLSQLAGSENVRKAASAEGMDSKDHGRYHVIKAQQILKGMSKDEILQTAEKLTGQKMKGRSAKSATLDIIAAASAAHRGIESLKV